MSEISRWDLNHHWYPFVDRDWRPIDPFRFEELHSNPLYRQLGDHDISEVDNPWLSIRVSTVWLGVAQPCNTLFETMVFASGLFEWHNVDYVDKSSERYRTAAEAEEGHWAVLSIMSAYFDSPVVRNIKAPMLMPAQKELTAKE